MEEILRSAQDDNENPCMNTNMQGLLILQSPISNLQSPIYFCRYVFRKSPSSEIAQAIWSASGSMTMRKWSGVG